METTTTTTSIAIFKSIQEILREKREERIAKQDERRNNLRQQSK